MADLTSELRSLREGLLDARDRLGANICDEATREIERLRAIANTLQGNCIELEAENERLQAIVAKLPVTADGVPITECDEMVWVCQDGTILPVDGWYLYDDGVWGVRALDPTLGSKIVSLVPENQCYSTRAAAAEAAGGE